MDTNLNQLEAEKEASAEDMQQDFVEKNNKLIRQFESDKEEKMNENNKEYTEKISYIENNIFFEYLVNVTLIKGKANPTNIDFEYNQVNYNTNNY